MEVSPSVFARPILAAQIWVRGSIILLLLVSVLGIASCGGGASDVVVDNGGDSAPAPLPSPQILSACAASSYTAATAFTYADTKEVPVSPLTTAGDFLIVTIPEPAVGIGLALQGQTTGFKVIDHGIIFIDDAGNPTCITAPDGRNAPLAFNQIDFDDPPDDIIEDDLNVLLKRQTAALFFPNDGRQLDLPAGAYSFPVGNLDESTFDLAIDTMQPYLFYKVPTATQTTLKMNLFVAQGVGPGITSDPATAAGDPEITGALTVLNNVYANNANTALNLNVTVAIVPSSSVTIDSQSEMDSLLSGFPGPPAHDAMNIFIIGQIAIPGVPDGVLGTAAGIPGPFNRQATFNSGVLAEYQGDNTGTKLGFILAHELGHYLGLYHTSQTSADQAAIIGHDPIADTPVCATAVISGGGVTACPDTTNVMFPVVASVTPDPPISPLQGKVVRLNPGVALFDSDGDGILDSLDDDTPDPFAFVAVVDAVLDTEFISNEITVSGVNASGFTLASVTDGVLIKNDVALADPNTTVANGDRLKASIISSSIRGVKKTANLTVGNFGSEFSVTTASIWKTEASLPRPQGDSAINTVNGNIFVLGGSDGGGSIDTVYMYATASGRWTARTPMPTSRLQASSAEVGGIIYVMGGFNSSTGSTGVVEAYDPATDSWTSKTSMPSLSGGASAVGGKIYVFGNGGTRTDEYDPATDSWSPKMSAPIWRHGFTSSTVNGVIYVIGGIDFDGVSTAVAAYNPADDSWSTKTPMPTPRFGAASVSANGQIYVIGGNTDGMISGATHVVEKYDPATDSWSTKTPMPTPRYGVAGATHNGFVYAIGGKLSVQFLSTVERYNPAVDP